MGGGGTKPPHLLAFNQWWVRYRIAGNFGDQNIRGSVIIIMIIIKFVVYILLALQVKVASFMVIFMSPVFNHENHEYFAP